MENAVVFASILGEQLHVIRYIVGSGGAERTTTGYMGKDLRGGNGHIVQKALTILDDGQRGEGNVIFLDKFFGQVTCTVRNDFNSHN